VISDIDGTVTQSDLRGHILPKIGASYWAHSGVAKLYQSIHEQGYKFIYLSSRPIGFSDATKKYLKDIKQENVTMPPGPVLISPDRSSKSIYREMIIKQPHIFKISCLISIKNLF